VKLKTQRFMRIQIIDRKRETSMNKMPIREMLNMETKGPLYLSILKVKSIRKKEKLLLVFFVNLLLFFKPDDIDSDTRVRKPLDNEQEMKMQKMKSEKTKRELHIQELDYKIHVLE